MADPQLPLPGGQGDPPAPVDPTNSSFTITSRRFYCLIGSIAVAIAAAFALYYDLTTKMTYEHGFLAKEETVANLSVNVHEGFADLIDLIRYLHLGDLDSSHQTRIDDISRRIRDRKITNPTTSFNTSSLSFYDLPLEDEVVWKPSEVVDGAIALTLKEQNGRGSVDVYAMAGGQVVVCESFKEIHPETGEEETFFTVEVLNESTGYRTYYSKLDPVGACVQKAGAKVKRGDRIGKAIAASAISLRIGVKLPDSEQVYDPRPLLPPIESAPKPSQSFLDSIWPF